MAENVYNFQKENLNKATCIGVRAMLVWRYQENDFWQGCSLGLKNYLKVQSVIVNHTVIGSDYEKEHTL